MYPVVIGNGRCTSTDCVVRGYRIPKGVSIQQNFSRSLLVKAVKVAQTQTAQLCFAVRVAFV